MHRRSWQSSPLIPTRESLFTPSWRVLVFVAACVAIFALHFGLFQRNLDGLGPATAAAVALMLATEWLRGSRASGTGVDAATSFLAWMFALIAAFVLFDDKWKLGNDASLNLLFGFSLVLAALFAWRWGFWAFAAVSAASAFLLAARLPGRARHLGHPLPRPARRNRPDPRPGERSRRPIAGASAPCSLSPRPLSTGP